jgi:signal transduction histidine kinase
LQRELMMKDRLATAGTLAAGIAHEIRNPLAALTFAIEGAGEVLSGEPSPLDLADARAAIADATEATARVAVIVRDLSTLATPVESPMRPVDLRSVVDGASRLAAAQIKGRSKLERGEVDVPPVLGDPSRLVQVVLNLLINAARAGRDDADNTIRVSAHRADDRVELAISDTGIGMDDATRSRLFEPFFTTRRDSGGTGLGLSICKKIVEGAGGSIAIDSAPGRGTTVRIGLLVAA